MLVILFWLTLVVNPIVSVNAQEDDGFSLLELENETNDESGENELWDDEFWDDELWDDELWDDELWDDEFWEESETKVWEIQANSVKLTFPVKEEDGVIYTDYKVLFSKVSLQNAKTEEISDVTVKLDDLESGGTIEYELSSLASDTEYYVVVVPVDESWFNVDGLMTKEISFSTIGWNWEKTEHSVAADNVITWETATSVDKSITVNFNAWNDTQTVAIHLSSDGNNYTKHWEVDWSEGTYSMTVSSFGNYYIKITPLDNDGNIWAEKIVQVEVHDTKKAAAANIWNPKTWPELYALLFAAIIVYSVYTLFMRRSS